MLPGKLAAYEQIQRDFLPKLFPQQLSGDQQKPEQTSWLYGNWKTAIGPMDQCLLSVQHGSYAAYHQHNQSKVYQDYQQAIAPLLTSRHAEICLQFAFWESKCPDVQGNLYELRTYQLQPGKVKEWEYHWRKGLEYRRQFCQPVGAWFTQLGPLHTVHHMWAYKNLEERKKTREAAWETDGWAQTVLDTCRRQKEIYGMKETH